eukprot:6201442-Pleurochrysis_carterae.AAC.1
MKGVLHKCKNLMRDKCISTGTEQEDKALRALELPRRQTNQDGREEEERALRQMISGIIPEWQETNIKEKRGIIEIMKLWTADMMNLARIQMKNWMDKKNEHRARVQRRWDNRGIMKEAFQQWKAVTRPGAVDEANGEEHKKEKRANEKTYGIKLWGKTRTIPKIHKQ